MKIIIIKKRWGRNFFFLFAWRETLVFFFSLRAECKVWEEFLNSWITIYNILAFALREYYAVARKKLILKKLSPRRICFLFFFLVWKNFYFFFNNFLKEEKKSWDLIILVFIFLIKKKWEDEKSFIAIKLDSAKKKRKTKYSFQFPKWNKIICGWILLFFSLSFESERPLLFLYVRINKQAAVCARYKWPSLRKSTLWNQPNIFFY